MWILIRIIYPQPKRRVVISSMPLVYVFVCLPIYLWPRSSETNAPIGMRLFR